MGRLFTTIGLLLVCALLSTGVGANGDSSSGRVRFLELCSGCHGVPPDHRAMLAANNPDSLNSALNSVRQMSFMLTILSRGDIDNVAAYLGDALLNQAVTAVSLQGGGSGVVVSIPAGINCGVLCVWNFAPNTSVVLQAVPKIGSTFTGWSEGCTGTAECRVSSSQAKTVTARFERNGPLRDYSGMWWVGPSENGWGIAINQRAESGQQFNKLYVYDDQGQPVWYSMPGGLWSENFAVYRGPLYRPRSASLDRYDATQLQLGASVGEVTLRYLNADRAELSYSINGISATKSVVRQSAGETVADAPFGLEVVWRPPCRYCRDNRAPAPAQVGGLWWGGTAEDGWAVSVAPQRASFFGIWFTFALDGSTTWYVLPSGVWLGNQYSATMFRAQAGPWLGQLYDPKRLIVVPVGSALFDAELAGDFRFTYRFDSGVFASLVQSKTMARRAF